jgi:hypothetical protein
MSPLRTCQPNASYVLTDARVSLKALRANNVKKAAEFIDLGFGGTAMRVPFNDESFRQNLIEAISSSPQPG